MIDKRLKGILGRKRHCFMRTFPKIGEYVFACKWSDASPNDAWAVGFVTGIGRNYITCSPTGTRAFRHWFRISEEEGRKILAEYPQLEKIKA